MYFVSTIHFNDILFVIRGKTFQDGHQDGRRWLPKYNFYPFNIKKQIPPLLDNIQYNKSIYGLIYVI